MSVYDRKFPKNDSLLLMRSALCMNRSDGIRHLNPGISSFYFANLTVQLVEISKNMVILPVHQWACHIKIFAKLKLLENTNRPCGIP